jgi:hypothetical protein
MIIDFERTVAEQMVDLLDGLNEVVRPRAEQAVQRIAFYAQSAIMDGDAERLAANVRAEVSTLASLTSIAVSQAEHQIKAALVEVLGMVVNTLLAAA